MCATSIFILMLFLPAALLPLGFDTLFSTADLDEMGICLESLDEPLQTCL